jgi:hypothetical protein
VVLALLALASLVTVAQRMLLVRRQVLDAASGAGAAVPAGSGAGRSGAGDG